MIKHVLRRSLQFLAFHVPVRGRHKLADKVGSLLAPGVPLVESVNGVRIELDHSIRFHRMMFYRMYEEHIMNYLARRIGPGMVVLDPGANQGYFAARCLGLVRPGGHVYSFEPSRNCLERLARHNDLDQIEAWTLLPMALTDHQGEHVFYDTPRVITKGYACLEGVSDPVDKVAYPVRVTTVDAFAAEHGIDRIDFLKLDIEGSELPALHGAKRMLAGRAIRTIMVETNMGPGNREPAASIDRLLREAGFRSFQALRDGRTRPIDVMTRERLRDDIVWELQ